MSKYKNTTALIQALQQVMLPFFRKKFTTVRTGSVLSVSGKKAVVKIDGSGQNTLRYCSCKVGDTVLVLKQGTTLYTIGVRQ